MNKSINSLLENVRLSLKSDDVDFFPSVGAGMDLINKINADLIDKINAEIYREKDAKPKLGFGERFDDLVGQLKKRDDVKDPEALAAWIGRKKFGKERMSKLAKESTDVEELLVFEDVEDVLAFVEGLETLTEYEEPVGTYANGDLTVEWPSDADSDMRPRVKAVERKAGGLVTVKLAGYGTDVEAIFRLNGAAIEKMLGGRKLHKVK